MDWVGGSRQDLAHVDRDNKVVCMFTLTGNFNRLEAFMGTCEAMIAMYEEPDEVNALFTAYTDFKLKVIEKYAEYYKPDIYVNGDDVATSTGLFFAPEVYRKLIWPHEKRLAQAALAKGMIVEHHVCGKVDEIIPDIIATGASVWQTAQHMNDLVGIHEKYGDKLCIHGGWDSYGACSLTSAGEEDIRSEVRRCIDIYGGNGNFMLFPIIVGDPSNPMVEQKRGLVPRRVPPLSQQGLKHTARFQKLFVVSGKYVLGIKQYAYQAAGIHLVSSTVSVLIQLPAFTGSTYLPLMT